MNRGAAAFALLLVAGCSMKPKPEPENPLLADLVDARAGLQLLKDGRADEALQLLTRARQSHPRDATLPNALGLVLLYKREFPAAAKAFSDALDIDASFAEARVNRGAAYLEIGKLEEAESDFRMLAETPASREKLNARFNLGLLEMKRERWAEAEKNFSLVLNEDPLYTKAFRERGLARMKEGDHKSALKDFLEVLKDEPKDPVSNYQAALCLLTTDRRDLAVRYMERTAASAPESDEGRRARRFLESEPENGGVAR
jgi:tetratricopeptide (TPR) repeat protein